MKIQIITIILILSLINLVSAYYPGDIIEVNLNELETYSNYTIKGNTSDLNISVNNLIATIIIPIDYVLGDFEIVFYGYKEEKVVEHYYSSSGGGGGYYNLPETKQEVIVNKTEDKEEIVEEKEPEPIIEPEGSKIWVWLGIIIVIGIIILNIWLIYRSKRKTDNSQSDYYNSD